LRVVVLPYDVVRPYSTCVVAGWFVVHEIVAVVLVTEVDLMFESCGGVATVVNVKSAEVVVTPAAVRDFTR